MANKKRQPRRTGAWNLFYRDTNQSGTGFGIAVVGEINFPLNLDKLVRLIVPYRLLQFFRKTGKRTTLLKFVSGYRYSSRLNNNRASEELAMNRNYSGVGRSLPILELSAICQKSGTNVIEHRLMKMSIPLTKYVMLSFRLKRKNDHPAEKPNWPEPCNLECFVAPEDDNARASTKYYFHKVLSII